MSFYSQINAHYKIVSDDNASNWPWGDQTPDWSDFQQHRLFAKSPKAKKMIETLYDKIKDEQTFNKVFTDDVLNVDRKDDGSGDYRWKGVYDSLQDMVHSLQTLPSELGYFKRNGNHGISIYPVDLCLVLENLAFFKIK